MATIGTACARAHAKTAFGKVESVADRASDTIERRPFNVRLVYTALVDQILDQPSDSVISQCGDNGCIHPKATLQTARDVVLTATFPHAKVARGSHASFAWIEPQHDLAETHDVPATVRLWISHKKAHKSQNAFCVS